MHDLRIAKLGHIDQSFVDERIGVPHTPVFLYIVDTQRCPSRSKSAPKICAMKRFCLLAWAFVKIKQRLHWDGAYANEKKMQLASSVFSYWLE